MDYVFLNEPARRWMEMVPAESAKRALAFSYLSGLLICAKAGKERPDGTVDLRLRMKHDEFLDLHGCREDIRLNLLSHDAVVDALAELLRHAINPGKAYEDQPDAVRQALDALYLTGRRL